MESNAGVHPRAPRANTACWYARVMKNIEEDIASGVRALGLEVMPQALSDLALHMRRVLEMNSVMNLTSIKEPDFVPLHVLDSLSAHPYLEREPEGRLVDLGSGAGYPGIPLAIVSGRPVSLVESVQKKAAFLVSVCEELRLESTVHAIRAEELAIEQPRGYSVVTARALSALPSLVELASPLLSIGGALICLKGSPESSELERGDSAARRCGFVRERTDAIAVPGVDAVRTIVVYRKTMESNMRLPRRNGMAQRQPLA